MTDRSILHALKHGALARCPSCGEGPIFDGYLTVRTACPCCGEDLSHQRADDAPPYIVMMIVGHVVVGLMLGFEIAFKPPMWEHAAIFLPMTVIMSLVLLRPIKGGLIAFQWASGMHGFGPDAERWS